MNSVSLLEEWLAKHPSNTSRIYRLHVSAFFREVPLQRFLGGSLRLAREACRKHEERHAGDLAPATLRVRFAALRSFCRFCYEQNVLEWLLVYCGPSQTPVRDVTGPSLTHLKKLYKYLKAQSGDLGVRDVALFCVVFHLALRRSEVSSLDVDDVELEKGLLWVQRLKRRKVVRQDLQLPELTQEAIEDWLEVRGTSPGPLFLAGQGRRRLAATRLTGDGVYQVFERRRLEADVSTLVTPTGVRHTSITLAAEAASALRGMAAFTGHARERSTLVYVDPGREMTQLGLANAVASSLEI